MKRIINNFTLNPKKDILSGLTVALALIPEAVAFSFVAGVDPLVGLYGAFMMGLITALIGGPFFIYLLHSGRRLEGY
mgnify:CR=1 FL=1